jgi:hypothetical protein
MAYLLTICNGLSRQITPWLVAMISMGMLIAMISASFF